jgi:hypothetical protein
MQIFIAKKTNESVFSKFLTSLARLSLYSPKGRWILSIFFLRLKEAQMVIKNWHRR